jgi:DNA repair exonuclease SbcCD ATPase subunit
MLTVVAVAGVQAQPQTPPASGVPTDDMSPMQVHQLFDAMLVMQAQDALALSEPQYAQFVSRLKTLQDARRRNQQERVRMIAELQRMTNSRNPQPPDESEITRRLSALQELEARQAAELRRAYNGIDEVLSPLQRARFRVLEEQTERRKLELVGRARQNQRPPGRKPPGRQ